MAYALHERAETGLPEAWVPLYNFDDGHIAYLDYSALNSEGEPSVIAASYNGSQYVLEGTVAEDFGAFVLRLVREQLKANT